MTTRAAAMLLLLLLPQDAAEERVREFVETMKAAASDGERLAAIRTVAKTRHLKVAQKLTQVAGGPYSDDVRAAAADAAGRVGDPKAGTGLLVVLNSFGSLIASENPRTPGDQKVAEAVVRAIGRCRDRSSTPRLVQIITKNNVPLIAEAVLALATIRDPSALDQLVRQYRAAITPEMPNTPNPRKPLIGDLLTALRRISGQNFTDAGDWEAWWKRSKGGFAPPPEESLGGLPPGVRRFAAYSGKGELEALSRYDLVLLNPEHYVKEDLDGLLAIATSGEPQAALDKGFAGFLVAPEKAEEMRRAFPKALIAARGGAAQAGAHAHAVLVEGLDPKKPDTKAIAELQEASRRYATAILALFVAEDKGDAAAAVRFARDSGFIPYVAPDAKGSRLGDPPR